MAAVWTVAVAVAIWRVPERRRRYLPTAVVVFTLVRFIGIRLISLHQVDALLHNRDVRGVTIGAVMEVGLLVVVLAVSAWRFRRPSGAQADWRIGSDVATDRDWRLTAPEMTDDAGWTPPRRGEDTPS